MGNIRGNSPEAGTPPENQPEEEVGKIKIIKVEQGKPDIKIAGAVFRITKSDDTSVGPIILTTDLNGEAISPDLVPGDYQIKEIHVPAGYLLNSQTITVTVTAGNTYECTISDRKVPPIPSTGFSGAAKSMTSDSGIPEEYTDTEMELEIPMLDITIPIVKVPLK
ncbi:MAG: Cna protein B-type domain protein [Chloroflexi bacterium ADurb.Bin344]|nr:MAG: Cna protein B-type domain protein [Chloroflexi bacterium ADurb.Bin344]